MGRVFIPTADRADDEVEAYLQVAPGLGVYATDSLLLGARMALSWQLIDARLMQFVLEPYVRVDFAGEGFVNARFTVDFAEPDEAFDEGSVWGTHVGGGLAF